MHTHSGTVRKPLCLLMTLVTKTFTAHVLYEEFNLPAGPEVGRSGGSFFPPFQRAIEGAGGGVGGAEVSGPQDTQGLSCQSGQGDRQLEKEMHGHLLQSLAWDRV